MMDITPVSTLALIVHIRTKCFLSVRKLQSGLIISQSFYRLVKQNAVNKVENPAESAVQSTEYWPDSCSTPYPQKLQLRSKHKVIQGWCKKIHKSINHVTSQSCNFVALKLGHSSPKPQSNRLIITNQNWIASCWKPKNRKKPNKIIRKIWQVNGCERREAAVSMMFYKVELLPKEHEYWSLVLAHTHTWFASGLKVKRNLWLSLSVSIRFQWRLGVTTWVWKAHVWCEKKRQEAHR